MDFAGNARKDIVFGGEFVTNYNVMKKYKIIVTTVFPTMLINTVYALEFHKIIVLFTIKVFAFHVNLDIIGQLEANAKEPLGIV